MSSTSLSSFFVFNPTLAGGEDSQIQKILCYIPSEIPLQAQLREIGLCEAISNFSKYRLYLR